MSNEQLKINKCQLIREQEMNLFYQCTQDIVNSYALKHYGDDSDSYGTWFCDYCKCSETVRKSQNLKLEDYQCSPTPETFTMDICSVCDVGIEYQVHPELVYGSPEQIWHQEATDKSFLPDFSGYWISRLQSDLTNRDNLHEEQVTHGMCIEQVADEKNVNLAAIKLHRPGTDKSVS